MVDNNKHYIFIYKTKRKQKGTNADIASIPLCNKNDKNENIIAYYGVLWKSQVPDRNVEVNKLSAKEDYIAFSDEVDLDKIDEYLDGLGYKRLEEQDIEDYMIKAPL